MMISRQEHDTGSFERGELEKQTILDIFWKQDVTKYDCNSRKFVRINRNSNENDTKGLKFFSEHQNVFALRSFKASPIEAQQDVAGNLNNQRITVVGCVAFANLHIINVLSLHKRTTNFRLFHNFSPHFD